MNHPPNQMFLELIESEQIIIAGGILFAENHAKMVLPSCCAGLGDWRVVHNGGIYRKNLWMGHDPHPTMKFLGDTVRVWSDDALGIFHDLPKENLYFIDYERSQLLHQLRGIEHELEAFIHLPFSIESGNGSQTSPK